LLHYTQRIESDLKPVSFPRFCHSAPIDAAAVLDIPLDPEVQQSIEQEVERQGASLEQLTAHAVLVYLADLDRSPERKIESEPLSLL
jgi:hypothetical protein